MCSNYRTRNQISVLWTIVDLFVRYDQCLATIRKDDTTNDIKRQDLHLLGCFHLVDFVTSEPAMVDEISRYTGA